MASTAPAAHNFDIGRVFSRTASLVGTHWRVLVPIALIVAVLSGAMNAFMITSMLGAIDQDDSSAALNFLASPAYWGTIIGGMVLGAFALSAMLSQMLGTGDEGLGGAMAAGARHMLPMLALMLLWFLGVGLGWLLLVIPGLILMTMWSLSTPVLIAEQTGVFGAFSRSSALTRGFRWRIFGALFIFGMVYSAALGTVSGSSGFAMGRMGAAALQDSSWLIGSTVLGAALGALISVVLYAFLAALYLEAVEAKEGGRSEDLASVFS